MIGVSSSLVLEPLLGVANLPYKIGDWGIVIDYSPRPRLPPVTEQSRTPTGKQATRSVSDRRSASPHKLTTVLRCNGWGIWATIALPISREDVAAGEGALQTWTEFWP